MNLSRQGRLTPRTLVIMALLLAAFLFRLWYGTCSEFWFEDELQVYLLGLKFYATGTWPYFGPDVTPTIQIPGALQGLLVGLPFFVYAAPEAPYVLLNLVTFASLCFFAWYCARRFPETPAWIIWTWLLSAPWTLNLSTHILNPSYVLPGGVLFFVAWLELYPPTTRRLIAPSHCYLMLGFSLGWVMQFHLSWVVLAPFALAAFYFHERRAFAPTADKSTHLATHSGVPRSRLRHIACFVFGLCVTGAFVVPTYLKYGFSGGAGDTAAAIVFNRANLLRHLNPVEGVLGRFLSFASFELPRFIGGNNVARRQFLADHRALAPLTLGLGAIGILQPIALMLLWFRRRHPLQPDWVALKRLTLATLLLLYASFLFSFRAPASHTFYVTLPLAFVYSFYCWSPYLRRRGWQIFAAVFLGCGVVFHTGLALHNRARHSLYLNRALPQSALDAHDYRRLGERRTGARY